MSGRLSTVSIKAASSTVRVIGPRCATVPKGDSGQAGTRPKVGFRPTIPQKLAGMRIEPPPSVPTCSAPIPSAAATAAPPLEPPGVRAMSQGLRATWPSGLSVTAFQPNSGVVVLPSSTAPASRSRAGGRGVGGGRRVALGGVAATPRGPAAGQDQILDGRGHTVEQAQWARHAASAPPIPEPPPARPRRRPGRRRGPGRSSARSESRQASVASTGDSSLRR